MHLRNSSPEFCHFSGTSAARKPHSSSSKLDRWSLVCNEACDVYVTRYVTRYSTQKGFLRHVDSQQAWLYTGYVMRSVTNVRGCSVIYPANTHCQTNPFLLHPNPTLTERCARLQRFLGASHGSHLRKTGPGPVRTRAQSLDAFGDLEGSKGRLIAIVGTDI